MLKLEPAKLSKKKTGIKMTLVSTPIIASATRLKNLSPKQPTGPDPINPRLYFGSWGAKYNHEGVRCEGRTSIPVLEFLWGRKLDEVVMAYVHGLNPTMVRITEDWTTLDTCLGRVTIYAKRIKRAHFVTSISQEIRVNLPEGVAHSAALAQARQHGLRSPRVKWHLDAQGAASIHGAFYKQVKTGCWIRWHFKPLRRNPRLWIKVKKSD